MVLALGVDAQDNRPGFVAGRPKYVDPQQRSVTARDGHVALDMQMAGGLVTVTGGRAMPRILIHA